MTECASWQQLKIYRTQVCVSSSLTAGNSVSPYVIRNYGKDHPTEGVHNAILIIDET